MAEPSLQLRSAAPLASLSPPAHSANEPPPPKPICQLCGSRLIEIRAKLQCERCHTIWETCCEGGRG